MPQLQSTQNLMVQSKGLPIFDGLDGRRYSGDKAVIARKPCHPLRTHSSCASYQFVASSGCSLSINEPSVAAVAYLSLV
jgi:hypothetical protein